MSQAPDIREGMAVYGDGDRLIGRVERLHGDGFHVAGQHYGRDQVARVTGEALYLRGTGTTAAAGLASRDVGAGELRVPVAEERLTVDTREVELGEVGIRKTVTQEEQTAAVTLRRDEVKVQEVDVADRPLRAGEDAFDEGTIRVQLRGEEAVVAKEAVVTGEVVVNKESVAREEQVGGTVRKQRVDVDKAYQEARTGFEQAHATTAATTGRTFAQAEPNYRSGYSAAHDERYTDREFEDVEPTLRSEYETTTTTTGGDSWEQLRQEVRAGWNKARHR